MADLKTGRYLLICLSTLLVLLFLSSIFSYKLHFSDPECETEIDSDDYWQALLDYLSSKLKINGFVSMLTGALYLESYECDVKRCVDLCKLEEGDEEHIGRVLSYMHFLQCTYTIL